MMYPMKRTPLAAAMLLALNAPFYSFTASAATTAGSETQINTYVTGNQQNPSMAMDASGDYVVTWQSIGQNGSNGVYARVYQPNGSPITGEIQVATYNVNTSTTAAVPPWKPSVAMDAEGDFVVVWQSYDTSGAGSMYDVYAQRYNPDGTPASIAFEVNTYTTSEQISPSVAMDASGDFVVAWDSYYINDPSTSPPGGSLSQDGSYDGIFARRFNANGTPKDSTEFLVNTSFTTGAQVTPSVAMDATGDFVVAWASGGDQEGTGSYYGIYAKTYHADRTVNLPEFHVNKYTTGYQQHPSVAMDAAGDFVVAWESQGQDDNTAEPNGYGIYAQRYSATGTPAFSAPFLVNTTITSDQKRPSVAMDTNGEFVIAWNSLSTTATQDGSGAAVEAQLYNASATKNGGEFQVNTWATNNQGFPATAMDASGNYAIAWESKGQDNLPITTSNPADYGIYAQRYTGSTAASVDLGLVVNSSASTVTVGTNFSYSLITTNNSTGYAMDVKLSEPLPTGLTYVSDDSATSGWSCTQSAATIACSRPYMAAGASNTINVTVTANTAGTLTNTVTASSAQVDANPADNTSTVTTQVNGTSSGGGGGSLGVFTLLFALPLWLRRRLTR